MAHNPVFKREHKTPKDQPDQRSIKRNRQKIINQLGEITSTKLSKFLCLTRESIRHKSQRQSSSIQYVEATKEAITQSHLRVNWTIMIWLSLSLTVSPKIWLNHTLLLIVTQQLSTSTKSRMRMVEIWIQVDLDQDHEGPQNPIHRLNWVSMT